MTIDIKEFYYSTPIARYKYMKLALEFFLDEIIEQYDLLSLVYPNGWIYMDIAKACRVSNKPAALPMTG